MHTGVVFHSKYKIYVQIADNESQQKMHSTNKMQITTIITNTYFDAKNIKKNCRTQYVYHSKMQR